MQQQSKYILGIDPAVPDNNPIVVRVYGTMSDTHEKGENIGWNGKHMFVYYVPAASYPPMTEVAKSFFGENLVPYNPYLAIKNVDGTVSPWTPSINDCLAKDWYIVE